MIKKIVLKSKNKRHHQKKQKHYSASLFNIMKVLFSAFTELCFSLPELIRLHFIYKKHNTNLSNPIIVLVGDNLDEVNGIALHVKLLIRMFKKKNKRVYAVGVTYHTNKPRIEEQRLLFTRRKTSVDQPSYSNSESAVPNLKILLKFMRRYPISLIEFETPGVFSFMMLFVSKIIGIQTVHHYRTDILFYVQILIKNKIGIKIVCASIIWFTRHAGTVIIPSETMRYTIKKMGVPEHKIVYIPRGVDTNRFNPSHKIKNLWKKKISSKKGNRLLYMGRISEEKNLKIFKQILPEIFKLFPNCQFCFVGHGPYLENLKTFFSSFPQVFFTGLIEGEKLAQIMADADLFVFPSHTDTFGNSVAEALASGLPCIVSNRGGPSQIIENNKSGFICNYLKPLEFQEKILWLLKNPNELKKFQLNAYIRVKSMTHQKSVEKFLQFYQKEILANKKK